MPRLNYAGRIQLTKLSEGAVGLRNEIPAHAVPVLVEETIVKSREDTGDAFFRQMLKSALIGREAQSLPVSV